MHQFKKRGDNMTIEDNTINKKFTELKEGECFIMYSEYYMKLYIKYNQTATYRNYAVNLKTGIAQVVNDDEKIRVVNGRLIIE